MNQILKTYGPIVLKGMGMGAADIVPGVSGGTIALITGIYEEFIDALKSFSSVLPLLKKGDIKGVWSHVNGNFLLALFTGIAISLLSLAVFIKYALANHAVLLWSFFFGLIIASCYYVGKTVSKWSASSSMGLLIGAISIFYISGLNPGETSHGLPYVFLAGMLAICAMILPGISGAFILVLLGKYNYIISSLSELRIDVIAVFGAGCLVGILSFSHLLSYMLKKHHNTSIAVLTGFMIGSLNKIWPWKNTLSWRIDRHGEEIPGIQENVFPSEFAAGEPQLGLAILLIIAGFLLIFGLEEMGKKFKKS